MKYVIIAIEQVVILAAGCRIRKIKISQIDGGKEPRLIAASWFTLNMLHVTFRILQYLFPEHRANLWWAVFLFIMIRNGVVCGIAWYYSIYKVNK